MSDIVKVIVDRDDIVAIADAVRSKNGTTKEMTIGQIITGIEEISGGNDTSMEDRLVDGTITEYVNDRVTSVKSYAFCECVSLTSINLPICTSIGTSAFYDCTSLISANFPACVTIGSYAFQSCSSLISANFPACVTIGSCAFQSCSSLASANFPVCASVGNYAFQLCVNLMSANFPTCTRVGMYAFGSCYSLISTNFPVCTIIGSGGFYYTNITTADFPACKTVYASAFQFCKSLKTVSLPACTKISGSYVFRSCYYLTALYLTGSTICTLQYSNAFSSTPIGGYSTSAGAYGYIYVPASLLASYQSAANWSYFSSRILAYDA